MLRTKGFDYLLKVSLVSHGTKVVQVGQKLLGYLSRDFSSRASLVVLFFGIQNLQSANSTGSIG